MDQRITNIEASIQDMGQRIVGLEKSVVGLETSVEGLDKRLSLVELDLRSLSNKIDDNAKTLNTKIDHNFIFMLGMMIGLAGMIAKGFGWLG